MTISKRSNLTFGKQDSKRYQVDLDADVKALFRQVNSTPAGGAATGTVYFGDENTDGTWRITQDGTDLLVQLRVGGVWEDRETYTP